MDKELPEITAIANEIIRKEFPLLANHYNNYDIRCIRRAIDEYNSRQAKATEAKEAKRNTRHNN